MKTRLISASLFAAAAGSAFAADLPLVVAPANSPPALSWTGFYTGLNAGYDWATTTNAATTASPLYDAVAVAANNLDPAHVVSGGLIPGNTALANMGNAGVRQSGGLVGAQIGYNYQWGQNFVAGLEADIQWTGARGSGAYAGASQDSIQWNDGPGAHPCGPAVNCVLVRTAAGAGRISAATDWLGTVRGRLGYVFTPALMIYGTGGLAYGGVTASASHLALVQGSIANLNPPYAGFNDVHSLATVPGSGHYSSTRVGWTAGGGAEWRFAPNWSFKTEALYYQLGNANLNSSPVVTTSPVTISVPPYLAVSAGQPLIASKPSTRVRYDSVIVRAGVNYHF